MHDCVRTHTPTALYTCACTGVSLHNRNVHIDVHYAQQRCIPTRTLYAATNAGVTMKMRRSRYLLTRVRTSLCARMHALKKPKPMPMPHTNTWTQTKVSFRVCYTRTQICRCAITDVPPRPEARTCTYSTRCHIHGCILTRVLHAYRPKPMYTRGFTLRARQTNARTHRCTRTEVLQHTYAKYLDARTRMCSDTRTAHTHTYSRVHAHVPLQGYHTHTHLTTQGDAYVLL